MVVFPKAGSTYKKTWIFSERPKPLSVSGTSDFIHFFFIYIETYIKYVFETSKSSDMKNGFKKIKKYPLKKFIYSGNWKLEKTIFERHQHNTAKGVDNPI